MPGSYPFQDVVRGTGDWGPNQRPEDWRQGLLYLDPNGMAPLTALLSVCKNKIVRDPHFHWWTKTMADQSAVCTATVGVSAAPGDVIVVSIADANDILQFRVGHVVLLKIATAATDEIRAKVTIVPSSATGTAGQISVVVLDTHAAGFAATNVIIIGNVNEEYAKMPDMVMYDPVEYSNFTQIFRTPLAHSGTALQTDLRTGDQLKQAKKDAMKYHGVEQERAFIWGVPTINVGAGGKPERTTGGIKNFITTNKYDWSDQTANWLDDGTAGTLGEDWLDDTLNTLFLWGSTEKIAYLGNNALLGIQRIAKKRGSFELTAMAMQYGIEVLKYTMGGGTLYLKTHPLFNLEPTFRNSMLVIDPKNLVYAPLRGRDTAYLDNRQENDRDGKASEFRTEAGLELHHEETFGWYDNIGADFGS